MASRLINIVKDFTLTLVRDGEQVIEKIAAGIQRLETDVADHWYTKVHSGDVPEGVSKENKKQGP